LSLPPIDQLKPQQSTEILTETRLPEDFTTAAVRHFCSMEFGGWCVRALIINNDAVNTITYRLHSDRGTGRIVPISSQIEINEWFDIIVITPDAVTGAGQLELDIVPFNEAFKRKRQ